VDNVDPREFTVGLERKLQVTVDEQLVESFRIARIGNPIQLDLDSGTAATRGWLGDICNHATGPEDDGFRPLKLHNRYLLPDPPEHLQGDTGPSMIAAKYERCRRRFVEAVELCGGRTMGAHQSVVDSVGSRVLHEAGPLE